MGSLGQVASLLQNLMNIIHILIADLILIGPSKLIHSTEGSL